MSKYFVQPCTNNAACTTILGTLLAQGQVVLQEAKVIAIAEFPCPNTKKQVQAFLGLAGYYRRFVPHFADKAAALTDYTKKEHPDKITWTPSLETSLQALKQALTSKLVLHCPDSRWLFVFQTE